MVITVVEAHVPAESIDALLATWEAVTGGSLPPGFIRSFLMRVDDRWRIATVWENREALEAMRRGTEVPGALAVFRAAGVEPALTVFDVKGYVEARP